MFIYKITNLINGKCYIGLDTGPIEEMRRWNTHKKSFTKNKVHQKLYNAINKHGIINFSCSVIDTSESIKDLKNKEEYWIKFFDSCKNGYNIIPTSNGAWTLKDMDPKDAEIKRNYCRIGAVNLNKKKWIDNDPKIILENRAKARKSLNDFYENKNRSEFVKANWDSLTEEERFEKTDGIRQYWIDKTPEERSAQARKASLKALQTNAKRYYVYDPSGKEYFVIGIGIFCKEHGLDEYQLKKVTTGRLDDLNGWKCYLADKETGEKIIPEKFIPKKRGPKKKNNEEKIRINDGYSLGSQE